MKRTWTGMAAAFFLTAAVTGCGAAEMKGEAVRAPALRAEHAGEGTAEKRIRIRDEAGHAVTFTLRDNSAAVSLYRQLPLSVPVENFSDNEKIFYPAPLDLSDAPHPPMEIGTLAYYAPWGNVVMFYGAYRANKDLYELGRAAEGLDEVPSLSGVITVEAEQEV